MSCNFIKFLDFFLILLHRFHSLAEGRGLLDERLCCIVMVSQPFDKGFGISKCLLNCAAHFSGPDRSSAGARREGAGLGDSPTRAIPLPRLQPRSAVSGDKDQRDPGAQGQSPRPRRARSARRRTALHGQRRLAAAARAPRPHSAPVQSLRDRQPRSDRPRETSADSRVLFPHPRLAARRRLAEGRGGGRPRLAPPPRPALKLLLGGSELSRGFPGTTGGLEAERERLGAALRFRRAEAGLLRAAASVLLWGSSQAVLAILPNG